MAQAAAIAALKDTEFLAKSAEINAAGYRKLTQAFDKLGLQYVPSDGNFVMCSRLRETVSLEAMRFSLATAASLLFPFAPHVCADIYDLLTGERVWEQPAPQAEEALLERDSYELVCQVNGKVRDRVQASANTSPEALKELCRAAPNVIAHVDGKQIVKEIVVPGKLVNFVVR